MIVLDASVVLEVVLATRAGLTVWDRVLSGQNTLHAPHLIDLEVVQVLRRYRASRDLSAERGRQAVKDLLDLPITRYPHDLLLPRIWELRDTVTAYDAAYLALAEALSAPFLTRDRRLASAVGHRASVELV